MGEEGSSAMSSRTSNDACAIEKQRGRWKFIGESTLYDGVTENKSWGSFYVHNEKRLNRRRPDPNACAFCNQSVHESEYFEKPNDNPIVGQQQLVIPSSHRTNIVAADVMVLLGRTEYEYAGYVNGPNAGRSQPHVHLNLVPAGSIPLPRWHVAPFMVCQDRRTGVVFQRLIADLYGLAVIGASPYLVAASISSWHEFADRLGVAYNLLAFPQLPSRWGAATPQLVLIPRSQEYCRVVDQTIGGLELLTGILIPGPGVSTIEIPQRDAAFRQATFGAAEQSWLEQKLCSYFR